MTDTKIKHVKEELIHQEPIHAKEEKSERSRRRRRSRSRGRDRKRRRRRRRSRSRSQSGSVERKAEFGKGVKPRGEGEFRHQNLWDVGPTEATDMGLLKELPINVGTDGGIMRADRAGRRIYVGNVPTDVKEMELRDFFNAVMIAAQGPGRKPGASVLGVFLNLAKRFAFVEFRNAVEATQAMDLDGIQFRGLNLKLGRPANYNANATSMASRMAPKLNLSKLGIVSSHVPNGPNKLYIGGVPYNLKMDQVRELVQTYGPLRGLWLSSDPMTGMSKGFAFAYYEDDSVTDAAIGGLNGLTIGDKRLVVKRHDSCAQFANDQAAAELAVPKEKMVQAEKTVTLCMLQMVTLEDLKDPEELEDIRIDIQGECQKYGNVISTVIPGLNPMGKPLPGAGRVYVQFSSIPEAESCKQALQGRAFAERTVLVTFYDDLKFVNQQYE
jgi:splicing factor U2AF subunit